MLKVAKLSEEPKQSLIPSSGEVNADDTADKSLSRASVQPVTQPKASTDLKTKNKRIPPSSKLKSPYKSLVASELAEEQGNQSSAAEAKKGEQDSGTTTIAIGQGEQPSAQVVPNAGQAPPFNEEKDLVLHNPEEKKSEGIVSMEDDSDADDLDK
ncbi:hypothetical protein Tco_1453766 [Tanacetum coccineum]